MIYTENLRIGDTGSLVEMLQLGLIRSGYLKGDIDGIFGEKTENAVKHFQYAFDLDTDGIAGEKTFNKLSRFIKGYYVRTILRGDSVWSLAAMYGTTVQAILTANPGLNPDALQIGQNLIIPFGFEVIPTDVSYSYQLIGYLIDGLKTRYPFINVDTFGKSVMGKDLPVIRVGTGSKQLFVNATFHANEWITIPVVMKFLENYLYAYSRKLMIENFSAEKLYSSVTLFVAPVINPDGVDLVTKALNSGEYYTRAKNIAASYPSVPFPSGWKANIDGTDLNLQFPAQWERAKEIKFAQGFNKPAPRDFVGRAPLTAPEAKAAAEITGSNNFRIIIAYHTQGKIIYWKFLDYLPPASKEVGDALSNASGYPLELTPENSSYAGYKDWFIQEYNRPGYTVEAGSGENPLPIMQFDEIYAANKPLLAQALNETSML